MIKTQGTVLEIFANKMVTTNLGHPVYYTFITGVKMSKPVKG